MNQTVQTYQKALSAVFDDGKLDEAALERFSKILKKNGNTHLMSKILDLFEKNMIKKGLYKKVETISARSIDSRLEGDIKNIFSGYNIEFKEDPSLVAGIKFILNNKILADFSLKGRLKQLKWHTK